MIGQRGSAQLHHQYGQQWVSHLKQAGAFYLGPTQATKTVRCPPWRPDRLLTVREDGSVYSLENTCAHNGARFMEPRAEAMVSRGTLVCPWHSWTYDTTGQLLRTGAMNIPPDICPNRALTARPVTVWQSLAFETAGDAADSLTRAFALIEQTVPGIFDLSHYLYRTTQVEPHDSDALMNIINYLDIAHLPNHRLTLGALVQTRGYTHVANADGVIQMVPLHARWMTETSDAAVYRYARAYGESGLPVPDYGAVWVTLRSGIMLEWYPGVIVVSQCVPNETDPWKSVFYHDFFYHQDTDDAFQAAHQTVFADTGDEDHVWCRGATAYLKTRMAAGQGDLPWGCVDPVYENYADWYYGVVDSVL